MGARERTTLETSIYALLTETTDSTIEGVWIDVTDREPIWIDAATARAARPTVTPPAPMLRAGEKAA
jgi:hypothetical protein